MSVFVRQKVSGKSMNLIQICYSTDYQFKPEFHLNNLFKHEFLLHFDTLDVKL